MTRPRKNHEFHVRCTREELEAFHKLARSHGMTLSKLVRTRLTAEAAKQRERSEMLRAMYPNRTTPWMDA